MRNPFGRREKNVLIPADEAEAIGDYPKFQVFEHQGQPCVAVNLTAVEAEVDAWVTAKSKKMADQALSGGRFSRMPTDPSEKEMKQVSEQAFNNPANWVEDMETVGGDDQITMMPFDVETGRIGR